jgi:hypothetical protein
MMPYQRNALAALTALFTTTTGCKFTQPSHVPPSPPTTKAFERATQALALLHLDQPQRTSAYNLILAQNRDGSVALGCAHALQETSCGVRAHVNAVWTGTRADGQMPCAIFFFFFSSFFPFRSAEFQNIQIRHM